MHRASNGMITAYTLYHEIYAITPGFRRGYLALLRFADGILHIPTHTHLSFDPILMIMALYDTILHTIYFCLFDWPHVYDL